MSEIEKPYLVCMRLGNPHVEKSVVGTCTRCGEHVWLAPSSQRILTRVIVICGECAVPMAEAAKAEGESIRFGGYLQDQLDELRDHDKHN